MNLSSVGKFLIHLQEAVLSAISTLITSHFRGLCAEAEYRVVAFSLLPLPVVLTLAPFPYVCEDLQLSQSPASVPFLTFVNSDSTSTYCIIQEGKFPVCRCWSLGPVPFVTLWAVARQPPLSVEFSKQEHWSV